MSGPPHDFEWNNARNWRCGWLRLYVAPRDPRLLMPMRPCWLGWTLNLGQRRTRLVLLVAFLVVLTALGFLVHYFPPGMRASSVT
jgi:uncharacterized membrane protein